MSRSIYQGVQTYDMTSADVKIDIVQWNTVSKNACTHHLWCVCIDWATFSLFDVRKCNPRHVRFWQVASMV